MTFASMLVPGHLPATTLSSPEDRRASGQRSEENNETSFDRRKKALG